MAPELTAAAAAPRPAAALGFTVVAPPEAASGELSDAQRAARRQGLGASEVAAVLGLDRYRQPFDVWLDKQGRLERAPATGPQRWGHLLEAPIAEAYVADLSAAGAFVHARPVGTLQHPGAPWALATPDRLIETPDEDWLLEVKTRSAFSARDWGEPGTDEVPDGVAVQAHWQMLVSGVARCDVAALIGGNDFRVYTLRADAALHADLLAQAGAWWQRHVVEGVEPALAGEGAARWVGARFPRVARDVVLDADAHGEQLLERLAFVTAQLKTYEGEKGDLQTQLKAVIGDAKGIAGAAGKVSWGDVRGRTTVDWDGVVQAAGVPREILSAFTTTGAPSRQFRFTPAAAWAPEAAS